MKLIKILFFVFSLAITKPCFSQESNWELTEKELVWKPSEPFVWDFPNNFKATVVYLQEGVISPWFGIIIKVDDWVEITRVIDEASFESERIKKRERAICDEELAERDEYCKELNKSLIDKIRNLEKEIISLDISKSRLESNNDLLKKGVVVSFIATASILIYYNFSN